MEIHMSLTLKQFLENQNSQHREKQSILPTRQCRNNNILPQLDNNETANIREHNWKENWDVLQSRNTL